MATQVTIFDKLNKSDPEHKAIAREKFLLHFICVLAIDLFLFAITWILFTRAQLNLRYLILPIVVIITNNGLVRYVVNWDKSLSKFTYGYFVCANDRRLKPSKYVSRDEIEGLHSTICTNCAPDIKEQFKEVRRKLEEAEKKAEVFNGRIVEINKSLDSFNKLLEFKDEELIRLFKENCRLEYELKKMRGE